MPISAHTEQTADHVKCDGKPDDGDQVLIAAKKLRHANHTKRITLDVRPNCTYHETLGEAGQVLLALKKLRHESKNATVLKFRNKVPMGRMSRYIYDDLR
jgi:hypothetical protein